MMLDTKQDKYNRTLPIISHSASYQNKWVYDGETSILKKWKWIGTSAWLVLCGMTGHFYSSPETLPNHTSDFYLNG